jgi:hypothetical protein
MEYVEPVIYREKVMKAYKESVKVEEMLLDDDDLDRLLLNDDPNEDMYNIMKIKTEAEIESEF